MTKEQAVKKLNQLAIVEGSNFASGWIENKVVDGIKVYYPVISVFNH